VLVSGGAEVSGFDVQEGPVLKADLRASGVEGKRPDQLFWHGQRQIMARYPNLDPAEPVTSGWAYVDDDPPPEDLVREFGAKRVLRVREADLRRWADPTLGRVFIFPSHEWWNNIVPIESVDVERRVIVLAKNCSYEIKGGDRYYVMGLPEELDAPGEWCADAEGEAVSFHPPEPLGQEPVVVPAVSTILSVDDASHVVVRGLTFEHCEGVAVRLRGAEDCTVAACTVRNVGNYGGSGIVVSGGKGNRIVGCDISDVGSNGIVLGGGDQKTRTPAANAAENNHITRTGVFYKQGSGVVVRGVGNRVARNLIHHVPRFAIQFGGNDHIIELNELHHVSLETTDTGAIYGGSLNWLSAHGVTIRHNWIHDVIGCGRRNGEWLTPFYAWGIYLDWTAMGTRTVGNIVARAPRGGIMLHDGRFNTIENNIVVDCGQQQIEFSGWTTNHFFWERGLGFGWVKQFESVADQPAWHGPDSTLRDPRTTALPDGRTMHSNRLFRNILRSGSEDAKTIFYRNVDFEANPSDYNLVWNGGRPIKTGLVTLEEVNGPNMLPNPDFSAGDAGAMPDGWSARLPWEGCTATLVEAPDAEGDRAIRIDARASQELADQPPWKRQVAVQSGRVKPEFGAHYRLSFRLKAGDTGTQVRIEALSFKGGAYDVRFGEDVSIGTDWQTCASEFRFPEPGDGNFHDGMQDTFYVRVILRQDAGELWIAEPSLKRGVPRDEWASWQAAGMDRHSVVADPHFVDPGHDDYRLKPTSPAWGLGFQSIPVERIGCYADPLRASWPVDHSGRVPAPRGSGQ
jgi:hypothetical protein